MVQRVIHKKGDIAMLEQVLPDLYRAEIPLPRNPLKAVNSYVIKGDGRYLIVDTGMNREECVQAMDSALAELQVDLDRTDFFVTHLHADHMGLVGGLLRDGSKVYFSRQEAGYLSAPQRRSDSREDSAAVYRSHGFPQEELERAVSTHPGHLYGSRRPITYTTVAEGDRLTIGDYSFVAIDTPGHTPGHMCLYEPNKKVLLTGDHILQDITPNICFWPRMANALKSYLASLDKVYPLEVKQVLPGHRTLWNDHRQRIKELHTHHRDRLNECLAALEGGPKNAWQVAPYVTWDVDYRSWESFPPSQKWFAMGEVIAHLVYLEEQQLALRHEEDGRTTYTLA